jgi:hypothetical protein
LADPSLPSNHPDKQALEDYLGDLRDQGGSSPQARQAYNQVLQEWNNSLGARVQQTEQQAVASGQAGPQIVQARNQAQAAVSAEQTRMQNQGLTPL